MKEQIVNRLAEVIRSGRAPRATVERVVATWDPSTSADALEAGVGALEALPRRDRHDSAVVEVKGATGSPVYVDFESRYRSPGMRELNPNEVETMRHLMAGVLHLPEDQRKAALNRAILNHYDGEGATVGRLGF